MLCIEELGRCVNGEVESEWMAPLCVEEGQYLKRFTTRTERG